MSLVYNSQVYEIKDIINMMLELGFVHNSKFNMFFYDNCYDILEWKFPTKIVAQSLHYKYTPMIPIEKDRSNMSLTGLMESLLAIYMHYGVILFGSKSGEKISKQFHFKEIMQNLVESVEEKHKQDQKKMLETYGE